jgi:hypothetical protein
MGYRDLVFADESAPTEEVRPTPGLSALGAVEHLLGVGAGFLGDFHAAEHA